MQIEVHAAKTRLSQSIEAALEGEDVVIARGNIPVVRLVPVRERFVFDILADKLKGLGPTFLNPWLRRTWLCGKGGAEGNS